MYIAKMLNKNKENNCIHLTMFHEGKEIKVEINERIDDFEYVEDNYYVMDGDVIISGPFKSIEVAKKALNKAIEAKRINKNKELTLDQKKKLNEEIKRDYPDFSTSNQAHNMGSGNFEM